MDAKSNLTIPLFSTQGIQHLLVIQSTRKERDWPKEFVPRLKLLGELFINALERRNAYRALSESESRLNLAADAAGAGLWVLNTDTNLFWLTEKTRDLFGFPLDGEITFEQFLNVVYSDDREQIRKALYQALLTKEESVIQYRITRPNASTRWMVSRGRIQSGQSAGPSLLMGVSIDITERGKAAGKPSNIACVYKQAADHPGRGASSSGPRIT